jgi:hypothetical protein
MADNQNGAEKHPPRNQLDLTKFFQLGQWFGIHEEWLKAELPSYREVAERAAKDLGFTVSPSNVKAVNEAKGKVYRPRGGIRTGTARPGGFKARLSEAENLIVRLLEDNQKLHARLDVMTGLVHSLYWQLDAIPPRGYVLPPNPDYKPSATGRRL